jgi:[ribosomal protein S18]-alanine N-acetyltransferase
LSIRRAALADQDAIIAMERETQTAARWCEAHYTAALTHSEYLVLVAEGDGRLAAFLVARAGPEWELESVVVAQGAQRRGIGAELIRELVRTAQANGASAIFLEVRESNRAARRLYESAGFALAGRRPAYYHGPAEDALIYRFFFHSDLAKTVEGGHPL